MTLDKTTAQYLQSQLGQINSDVAAALAGPTPSGVPAGAVQVAGIVVAQVAENVPVGVNTETDLTMFGGNDRIHVVLMDPATGKRTTIWLFKSDAAKLPVNLNVNWSLWVLFGDGSKPDQVFQAVSTPLS